MQIMVISKRSKWNIDFYIIQVSLGDFHDKIFLSFLKETVRNCHHPPMHLSLSTMNSHANTLRQICGKQISFCRTSSWYKGCSGYRNGSLWGGGSCRGWLLRSTGRGIMPNKKNDDYMQETPRNWRKNHIESYPISKKACFHYCSHEPLLHYRVSHKDIAWGYWSNSHSVRREKSHFTAILRLIFSKGLRAQVYQKNIW